MIKPLKRYNFFRHHDIRAQTRSRMTTAIVFYHQNNAGSRVHTTYGWENLVLRLVAVALIKESKGVNYL